MLRRERGRARRAITTAATEYRRALEEFEIGAPPPGTWRQNPFDTDPGRRTKVAPQRAAAALETVQKALSNMPAILDGIDEVMVTSAMTEEFLEFSGGTPEDFVDELENAVGDARLRNTEALGYTDEVAAFLRAGALIVDARSGERFGHLVVDLHAYMPEPQIAYLIYDALRIYHNTSNSRFHDVVKLFRDADRMP